jgi:hypothetical protein
VELSGSAVAGILTICGFAFFGKNVYNSFPITAGVWLYARLNKVPFKEYAVLSLFATALGPLVSVLSFGLGFPVWLGVLSGYLAGVLIGLVIPVLTDTCMHFHGGYNLYNIGFTAGIIGMFATGILRMFDFDVDTTMVISEGNNLPLSILLLSMFAAFFLVGLSYNGGSFAGFSALFRYSGRLKTDFVRLCGYGVTLINVAVMGLVAWAYVILIDGHLNGATMGAVFTVMGFSAFGNHLRNTLPIFAGALAASLLNIHEHSGTLAVIATLFGSTLAPVAGRFGVLAGLIAGFTHVAMTLNISYLHGGMNLYNNGFSGGFIAATLVPLFSAVSKKRGKWSGAGCEDEDGPVSPYRDLE